MPSYQHFTPGRKSNASKLILYTNLQSINVCPSYNCSYENLTNKNYESNTNFCNVSTQMRIGQFLSSNANLGGRTRFGNSLVNQPIPERCLNYLGRTPGQPGGSGKPLRNHF